jgi:hypothetical protein
MAKQFGEFIEQATDQGLCTQADGVHASALTKARAKVPWQVFQTLHHEAVTHALALFPADPRYQWKGMNVYAIDGSKFRLPASAAIRAHFDPESGLAQPGRGHYPMALVSTAYDVFRRVPLARSVVPIAQADERVQAQALLPQLPTGAVLVFDRGYPSAQMIHHGLTHYNGHVLFRCPATNSFAAVTAFIKSGRHEAMITLAPTSTTPAITLRAIRLSGPDGKLSVLLTSLQDRQQYSRQSIIKLYFRRWRIETHYRTEKQHVQIEQFHARTVNGVLQELFAVLAVMVMAQTFAALTVPVRETAKCVVFAQLKYAITAFGQKLFCFIVPRWRAVRHLLERLVQTLHRHRHYQPKTPKPSQPRASKTPANKWQSQKIQRLGA